MIRASKTRVFLLYPSEIGSRLLGTHDYALTAMSQCLALVVRQRLFSLMS